MSVSTQFALSEVTLTGATEQRITNVDAPVANTEYSLALSANLKSITIRSRLVSRVQFAFVSGESNVTYMTIPAGASFSQSNLTLSAATLYFQTNIDSNTLEVLEFF
jgi:hypothetical protein